MLIIFLSTLCLNLISVSISISTVYLHEALKLNFANLTINVNKKEKNMYAMTCMQQNYKVSDSTSSLISWGVSYF